MRKVVPEGLQDRVDRFERDAGLEQDADYGGCGPLPDIVTLFSGGSTRCTAVNQKAARANLRFMSCTQIISADKANNRGKGSCRSLSAI